MKYLLIAAAILAGGYLALGSEDENSLYMSDEAIAQEAKDAFHRMECDGYEYDSRTNTWVQVREYDHQQAMQCYQTR